MPDAGDSLLPALIAAYPAGEARTGAAWRLATAAGAMDEAAVLTIDAWCQRMLREHAFESLALFDEELLADDRPLIGEAAHDYWRQQLYPLWGDALRAALGVWPSVGALTDDVRALLGRTETPPGDLATLGELIGQLGAQRSQMLAELKSGWSARARAMGDWIEAQLSCTPCPFTKTKLQSGRCATWIAALAEWADHPTLERPALSDAAWSRLRPPGLREAHKAPSTSLELPEHFHAFDALAGRLADLPDLRTPVRLHAATCVARRVAELKRRSGNYAFIDLQERLALALEGPNAERLRERIVAQYPVALVDEFQDTSPRQYGIFEGLYRPAENDPATALFLIGDPKQSIYGFRGADIYSYLRAHRTTHGRHYRLDINHRSTEPLVAALNRLWNQAETREGAGAFLFRDGAGNMLPYAPVRARGRRERLVTAAGAVPAVTVCHDTEARDTTASLSHFAALCAEQIVALLNDRRAGFEDALPAAGTAATLTPLRAADLAVLVRTGREATAVRDALRQRGVTSVYLSDQDSVFATPEARDVALWLRAVANPGDTRLARAAHATRLAALTLEELRLLAVDEAAWERRLDDLRALHALWQRQGVLGMLRELLQRQGLPARWLREPGGERRLTNVLHIAELLQAASLRHEGEAALLRWLVSQMGSAMGDEDERIVRLESDADLVKVITIHKSKGLEFPVVFLPYAGSYRAVDTKRGFVETVDGEGRRGLNFGMGREAVEAADRERLREDLRLLYVALTRARHAVWLGVVAPREERRDRGMHRSAFGQLIGGGAPIAADQLPALLEAARGDCPAIVLTAAAGEPGRTLLAARDPVRPLPPAPVYTGAFDRQWTIGSYSTLVRGTPTGTIVSPATLRDDEVEVEVESLARRVADAPWHRFPRGVLPGNFLHEQLQWLAEERFGLNASGALEERLRRRCEQQGWGHRQDDVVAWLQATVAAPLPPLGASLQQIRSPLAEVEFWLPSERLHAQQVDALCRHHLLGGRERPALPLRQLQGMLMGFLDLVFEHEGRYWVLDYKSNALGGDDAAYHAGALAAAMANHRYDVQGALYLLALHRLLRARLGAGYAPARHLGGALFYFFRGLQGPAAGCHVVPADLELLDTLDDALGARKAV